MRTTIIITTTLIFCGCGASSRELPGDGGVDDVLPGIDGPASSCTPSSAPKGDGVSRSVTFAFSSTGGGQAWIVTAGEWCSPFFIKGLELSAPYTVTCEGPPPPSAYVSGALPLSENPTITWNGTRLASHTECVDCAQQGWSGMGVVSSTQYSSISATPGSYTAEFGVFEAVPQGCTEDPATGELACQDPYGGWGGSGMSGGTCPMPERVVSVSFTLPQAAGAITVPVEVSTAP